MKIRCENCSAKYSISQDLLKKELTRFRCKKCQHVMSVRQPEPEQRIPETRYEPEPAITEAQQAQMDALDDEFDRALEAEEAQDDPKTMITRTILPNHSEQGLVLARDLQAQENRQEAEGQEEVSTRVFTINALQTLRSERQQAQKDRLEQLQVRKPPQRPKPAAAPQERREWYVLKGDRQLGPWSTSQVNQKIHQKELESSTFAWREGLADWRPLSEVPTFSAALLSPSEPDAGGRPISFVPPDLQATAAKQAQALEQPSEASSPLARLLSEPSEPIQAAPAIPALSLSASPFPAPSGSLFTPEAEQKQERLKLLASVLAGVLVLVLVGGGIGGYAWYSSQPKGHTSGHFQGPTIQTRQAIPVPTSRTPQKQAQPKAPKPTKTPKIQPRTSQKAAKTRPSRKKTRIRRKPRRKPRRTRKKRIKPKKRPDFLRLPPPPPPPPPPGDPTATKSSKTKSTLNDGELSKLLGSKPK